MWTFSVAFLLTLTTIFRSAYQEAYVLTIANKDNQVFNNLLWNVVLALEDDTRWMGLLDY